MVAIAYLAMPLALVRVQSSRVAKAAKTGLSRCYVKVLTTLAVTQASTWRTNNHKYGLFVGADVRITPGICFALTRVPATDRSRILLWGRTQLKPSYRLCSYFTMAYSGRTRSAAYFQMSATWSSLMPRVIRLHFPIYQS